MTTTPNAHVARFDFRLDLAHKEQIERAAAISGVTVSSFATAALLRAADEAIERASTRTLSARDSQAFMAMLADDSEPNVALKKAAKRYGESTHR